MNQTSDYLFDFKVFHNFINILLYFFLCVYKVPPKVYPITIKAIAQRTYTTASSIVIIFSSVF